MVTNLCITDFTVSTKLKNSICSSFFKVILFENFNVFKLYKKDVHFNIIDLVLIQRIYPEGWYRFTPNIKIDLLRLPSFTTFEIFFYLAKSCFGPKWIGPKWNGPKWIDPKRIGSKWIGQTQGKKLRDFQIIGMLHDLSACLPCSKF